MAPRIGGWATLSLLLGCVSGGPGKPAETTDSPTATDSTADSGAPPDTRAKSHRDEAASRRNREVERSPQQHPAARRPAGCFSIPEPSGRRPRPAQLRPWAAAMRARQKKRRPEDRLSHMRTELGGPT